MPSSHRVSEQSSRTPCAALTACAALALALGQLACSSAPATAPAIGEAFAGPASLGLHADVDPKSPVVAHARHADRLKILAQRRRWYKVRTANGLEGWATDRDLLDAAQMQRLRALAAETAGLPSQGKATVFATVNVHIEPSRLATSFVQLQPMEEFDVVSHRVMQRGPAPKRELLPPVPKAPKKQKTAKDKTAKSTVALPPPPAPPAPPPNWLDLSKTEAPEAENPATPAGPAPVFDDFTLIRTADGHTGWILSSTVYMKVPDEIAQYAEGHRITSYFTLGSTNEQEGVKPIWLWTTSEHLGEPYDFDAVRVFAWNVRHRRYETAFSQRHLTGYLPVQAGAAHFSVCVEDKNGARVRREYSLSGTAVHFASEQPCPAQKPVAATPAPEFSLSLKDAAQATATKTAGWVAQIRARWNKLLGRGDAAQKQ